MIVGGYLDCLFPMEVSMRRILISFSLVSAILLLACRTAAEPEASTRYQLIAVDGRPVPADAGPLIMFRDTVLSLACRVLIPGGWLNLVPDRGHFSFEYIKTNGCNGDTLNVITLEGSYRRSGDSLSFLVPAVIPPDYAFVGSVLSNRIVVKFPDQVMVFGTNPISQ
jgi:hypothetical protein